SARRAMPLLLAAALVYAVLVVGRLEAVAVLLAFAACAAALGEDPPPRAPFLIPIGGGILAAVELLGKINFGVTILALCLIAVLAGSDRRRSLPLFAATLFSSLLVLWVLAGQSPADVPDYVSHSLEVLGGYSEAMAADVTAVGWQLPYAVAAVVLLVAAAAVAGAGRGRLRQLALTLLAAVFGFAMFKQSFVRQGLGNASDFFPLMLGAALVLAWQLPDRVRRLPPHAPAALLLAPLVALSIAALPSPSLWHSLQPGDHVEYLRQDLDALAGSGEREELIEEGADSMRSTYRIDPATLAALRDREVAVEPWEIGAAWAYDLEWKPLPVIQGYQAYTPALDALDVDALASPRRPAAILRQNTAAFQGVVDRSIDDRYPPWDPPAAAIEMLCGYHAVRTTPRWQVLYPAAERCGAERQIARVTASTGEAIRVPAPARGSIVFARVDGLGVEGLETLRSLLYRARERWATVNGEESWRVVPGTLGDGLILRSDPRVDFPAPFRLAPQARTISFRLAGGERAIEVAFFSQRIFS
ncbi:MAG TPA: hypothetical protein VNM41_03365, partial [Solirubrobacterales bacterium]|nr:hypothetical protein [Solirubrobacterales bacterium]